MIWAGFACSYYVTLPAPDTSPTDTTTPGGPIGPPPGDLGSLVIAEDGGSVSVYGFFVESATDYLDLARCALAEAPCLPRASSTDGPPVFVPGGPSLDAEDLTSRFAGDVSFGPYLPTYREDPDTGLGGYEALSAEVAAGWIGASWGGQWPEYAGTADLFVHAPLVVTAAPTALPTGRQSAVSWVPDGAPQVTIAVTAANGDALVYTRDDDGEFTFDPIEVVAELDLAGPVDAVTVTVSRWSLATALWVGHVIEYAATSEVSFDAEIVQVGPREQVEPMDDCGRADGAAALGPGQYWGHLGVPRTDADLDAPAACLDPASTNPSAGAAGPDGVYRLEVPPGHAYAIDYTLLESNGAVYVVSDCEDPAGTCVDGSDLDAGADGRELVAAPNLTGEPLTLYLVVDATEPGVEGVFTLDLFDIEL